MGQARALRRPRRPPAVPVLRLPYSLLMTDQRKALHDQIEQTPEEDLDRLVGLISSFLHPQESPPSQGIVFEPVPAGSKRAAEVERQRQEALARHRARQSEMIARSIGDTLPRLGIDLNKIEEGLCGWSASGLKLANFTCTWFEGRVFNRLNMFHLKEQKVVTLERCHISETQPELVYKVRVLTPIADGGKELTVPI
jgi:hypothetical protein